jgi:phosphoribosylaminoimidazole (AIR) synthetase
MGAGMALFIQTPYIADVMKVIHHIEPNAWCGGEVSKSHDGKKRVAIHPLAICFEEDSMSIR